MMQLYISNFEGFFKLDAQFNIIVEFDVFNCITAERIPDQSVDQDLPTGIEARHHNSRLIDQYAVPTAHACTARRPEVPRQERVPSFRIHVVRERSPCSRRASARRFWYSRMLRSRPSSTTCTELMRWMPPPAGIVYRDVCGCPLFGKHYLRFSAGSSIGRVSGLTMWPSMTPRVGHAVRKAGFTSVQRAASARAPGLNFPALNFEVRIAYSSSIAHPGL
jgi:hypothetical protein